MEAIERMCWVLVDGVCCSLYLGSNYRERPEDLDWPHERWGVGGSIDYRRLYA